MRHLAAFQCLSFPPLVFPFSMDQLFREIWARAGRKRAETFLCGCENEVGRHMLSVLNTSLPPPPPQKKTLETFGNILPHVLVVHLCKLKKEVLHQHRSYSTRHYSILHTRSVRLYVMCYAWILL
jgi:hypothetical protein